jgi:hypothetical protein
VRVRRPYGRLMSRLCPRDDALALYPTALDRLYPCSLVTGGLE